MLLLHGITTLNRRFDRLYLLLFSVLITLLLVSTVSANSQQVSTQNPDLEVHFIDVDTGDAILIKVLVEGQNRWLLIDGGFDDYGKNRIVPYLKQKGVKELEYVIATHYEGDHIGGLDEVFSEVNVKHLYARQGLPLMEINSHDYKIFKTYKASIAAYVPTGEQRAANIDLGLAHFELLTDGSRPDEATKEEDDEDLRSLVYLLTFNEKFNILLGADCYSYCEQEILDKLKEVLLYKVHWHGKDKNGRSTSSALLEKIKPEASVVSEGDYSGRPHQPVLDRLRNINSKICRTDLHGNIIFAISGNNWSIKSSKFNGECPDVFTVDSFGSARWQFSEGLDEKIWIKIKDAGDLINDKTQVIAVRHNETIKGIDLSKYTIHANVRASDEPFLLGTVDRLKIDSKFDLIVDFNGDNELSGNDFRERSAFHKGKKNEAWPSFKIVPKIVETDGKLSISSWIDTLPSNLMVGIAIGLSIGAIGVAIMAMVRRRR
ncbi:MAG: ComEC/Rec2 family competence protein [Nitrososphaerales archaeon]